MIVLQLIALFIVIFITLFLVVFLPVNIMLQGEYLTKLFRVNKYGFNKEITYGDVKFDKPPRTLVTLI